MKFLLVLPLLRRFTLLLNQFAKIFLKLKKGGREKQGISSEREVVSERTFFMFFFALHFRSIVS